jgi:hypothetical protein
MVVTQTVTAPALIGANILAGTTALFNEMAIYLITIGADDYAAGRTISITLLDEDASGLADIFSVNVDNQRVAGLQQRVILSTATTMTAASMGTQMIPLFVSGGDFLSFRCSSFVDGETLTIQIRGKIRDRTPVIQQVNGVETHTITRNKIIA